MKDSPMASTCSNVGSQIIERSSAAALFKYCTVLRALSQHSILNPGVGLGFGYLNSGVICIFIRLSVATERVLTSLPLLSGTG
jgi:hypothetical protein